MNTSTTHRKITHYALLFLLVINYTCYSQNILISSQNTPEEPSIKIDPKHPNIVIAASNIDNYYLSTDTGRTWSIHRLSSEYGVWGDPCIEVDTNSNFYFFHLSNPLAGGNWIDRIVCQKTSNNGATWNNGTYTGWNGTKAQDKQWCAVDRKQNILYLTWTQFDAYGSANPTDSSTVLFSKSVDEGTTWTTPKRINTVAGDCIDGDNTVEGAVPTVGLNGEVYVSWAGPSGLVFNKSLDGGTTWLAHETPIDPMPTGWEYSIEGINRCNGLPITVCDVSNSPYRGTIYVNWSDQRNGATNTDILLAKSTDAGNTWSAPIKVNNDNTNTQQFLSWLTVDPVTGYLYCVFYDRRNYTDTKTDVYVAISTDGGNSFINKKISDSPFIPQDDIFFGDYTNITAYNGIIRPIWTRLHNQQLSVWTALLDFNTLTSSIDEKTEEKDYITMETYPNPATEEVFVCYKLPKKSKIDIVLYDASGKVIQTILQGEIQEIGKHLQKINLKPFDLSAGSYYLELKINDKIKKSRVIVIK